MTKAERTRLNDKLDQADAILGRYEDPIGSALRQVYDDVAQEPVPESLTATLKLVGGNQDGVQ